MTRRGVPKPVQHFADALLGARLKDLSIDACMPPIEGVHGILTTTRIQYNQKAFNLLGREHEYLFWLPGPTLIEVSLQLYLNVKDHYRLFAYNKAGMLLSVNLTLNGDAAQSIVLQQRMKLSTQAMTQEQRSEGANLVAEHVRRMGLEVTPDRDVIFGTFDGRKGRFVDTNARAFLRDFLTTAVIKGHFMANKGYALPGLVRVAPANAAAMAARGKDNREISPGLRYRVLERDEGRCVLCGARATDGARLHVDHILPWSKGGATTFENLQTLCVKCNLGKGNRSRVDHRGAQSA